MLLGIEMRDGHFTLEYYLRNVPLAILLTVSGGEDRSLLGSV